MIPLRTFAETEEVLLRTIHRKGVSIKEIAEGTGVGLNGLYKWSSGACGISNKSADMILVWLKEHKPDELLAAAQSVEAESTYFKVEDLYK